MTTCKLNKTKRCKISKMRNQTCCNNSKLGQKWCWKNATVKNNCSHMKKMMKSRLVKGKNETCCINPLKGHWCWSNNLASTKMKRKCCGKV